MQDWYRPQDVIPDSLVNVTVSFGITVDPQSSSTADKAGCSILALDNRYDFSVTLWPQEDHLAENDFWRLEHHTVPGGMPRTEVTNHSA